MASLDFLTGRHATTSFDFTSRAEPASALILGTVERFQRTATTTATLLVTSEREIIAEAAIGIQGPTLISPLDTTVGSPVTFVWRGVQLSPTQTAHAELALAVGPDAAINPDGSFGTVAATWHSMHPVNGFEVDTSVANDGSGPWVAFPAQGLDADQQARMQRLTVVVVSGEWSWMTRLTRVVT